MDHLAENIRYFTAARRWGYDPKNQSSAEPAALASLALCAHGKTSIALRPAQWLASIQNDDGSVGINAEHATPPWPTSLAVLAWLAHQASGNSRFDDAIGRAIQWTLDEYGEAVALHENVGHDTTLRGWSWARHTHSWLEPTAMFVLALKAAGYDDHPRTREAVRMIVDRLLPTGGCNYGCTAVLGQNTLPQVEATGLAMLALADEQVDDPRIERSLEYLESRLDGETATASLCYGVLGLTAHDRRPAHAEKWLAEAFERQMGERPSAFKFALVLLANYPDRGWLPQDEVGSFATAGI